MPLTNQEIEAIAGMAHDPVYNLILDKVGCIIDDMTQTLASERDANKIKELFPLWQALNVVLHELRHTPATFATYIEKKESISEIDNMANDKLREFIRNSRKLYENEQVSEDLPKDENYGWKSLMKKENKLMNEL